MNFAREAAVLKDFAKKIRRRIKHIRPGTIVRLGGMADCLQPIEADYGVSRECGEKKRSRKDNGISKKDSTGE